MLSTVLVLAGSALRLVPLLVGAPVPHPDEFNAAFWPLLVALGDPAPEVFYYPYFHTYVLALLQLLRGLALAPPDVSLNSWLGIQYFWRPEAALLLARWVNALSGGVTMLLVAGLARQIYGRRAGLIALGLSAVAVLPVRQSPVAGLDVPMTMWYVAAAWSAVRLVSHPGTKGYLWAGVLAGLAASTKYHGALAAIPIVVAHVSLRRSLVDRRLWIAGGATVATFLAGSPYIVLTPAAFLAGFGDLVTHARTGLADQGPGWIHHILFSLRVNLGRPGLAALVVGLVLALRGGDVRQRVLATSWIGYYLVVGASPLVFARYALPLAMLQCVLAAGGLEWIATRTGSKRWMLAAGLALVALPPAYASLRIVDVLHSQDTRQQAVDWLEERVPAGARLCNFGSWSADPPLVTEAGTWWQVRRYVAQNGATGLRRLLPYLERSGPERPVYRYALQADWRRFESGNLRVIDESECDYVLTNDHPLSPVRLDSSFVGQLPSVAQRQARFTPAGWDVADPPEFDPIDAYYIPVSDFGDLRQAGPAIEIWRVRGARAVPAPDNSSRIVIASAILRGALAALEAGKVEDFARLQRRSMDISPTVVDGADYRRRLGWSYRRLGRIGEAASEWQRSLGLDPGNTRLWLELGLLAAAELDDPALAATCFGRVLALEPEHPKASLLHGFIEARR
ncbi:MAG: hypothetical protein CME04_03395 [Gemmatimonadaceae bacterium]|jgi:hypothetical protein|nr:hypothetical protein [Gemmatimonadaceae bacterium]